jgi:peptide methionine sulfoxide reductase msrA/msrB
MDNQKMKNKTVSSGDIHKEDKLREIWFAGGCFWGIEAYFSHIEGVVETTVGYANGKTENPTYHDIKRTGHVETVHIRYNPDMVSLETLLEYFFMVIDPTSINKQGGDIGTQYRTGIYYRDEAVKPIISAAMAEEQKKHKVQIATEVKELEHYFLAEDYHQDYLQKNPSGYCHVDLNILKNVKKKE